MGNLKFCRECAAENQKSIVFVIPDPPEKYPHMLHLFYDEDGRYHVHDWRVREFTFKCNRGHWWVDSAALPDCPTCGQEWTKPAEPDKPDA
jgi:hypothetical protein